MDNVQICSLALLLKPAKRASLKTQPAILSRYLAKMQQVLTPQENNQLERLEADAQVEGCPSPESRVCPYCHKGTLIWIGRLPRQQRAPP